MRRHFLVLIGLTAGWCQAQNLEESAASAAVADTLSTAGGLLLGAAEANPLGLAAGLLKIPAYAYAKSLPDEQRLAAMAAMDSVWGGAAVSNVCVMGAMLTGGVFAAACPLVGAGWGLWRWQSTEKEREFWEICARERTFWKNPTLKCTYTPAPQDAAPSVTPAAASLLEAP